MQLTFFSEWSQGDNFGWKNYESSWHPDTGYNKEVLDSHLPIRTFGDGDYHSAKMLLDLHTEDFNRECAQGLDLFHVIFLLFFCTDRFYNIMSQKILDIHITLTSEETF